MKNKEFKAVEFQRERRKEISDLVNSNPEEFERQLQNIRRKYKDKFHLKKEKKAS